MGLLSEYDDWSVRRADQSTLEAKGEARADDWYALDDEGCELAHAFAEHYKNVLSATSMIVRAWNGESNVPSLGEAVTALVELTELDTTSSASRQYWIEAGRYLQVDEVIES